MSGYIMREVSTPINTDPELLDGTRYDYCVYMVRHISDEIVNSNAHWNLDGDIIVPIKENNGANVFQVLKHTSGSLVDAKLVIGYQLVYQPGSSYKTTCTLRLRNASTISNTNNYMTGFYSCYIDSNKVDSWKVPTTKEEFYRFDEHTSSPLFGSVNYQTDSRTVLRYPIGSYGYDYYYDDKVVSNNYSSYWDNSSYDNIKYNTAKDKIQIIINEDTVIFIHRVTENRGRDSRRFFLAGNKIMLPDNSTQDAEQFSYIIGTRMDDGIGNHFDMWESERWQSVRPETFWGATSCARSLIGWFFGFYTPENKENPTNFPRALIETNPKPEKSAGCQVDVEAIMQGAHDPSAYYNKLHRRSKIRLLSRTVPIVPGDRIKGFLDQSVICAVSREIPIGTMLADGELLAIGNGIAIGWDVSNPPYVM